jgi:hypothetical protein
LISPFGLEAIDAPFAPLGIAPFLLCPFIGLLLR